MDAVGSFDENVFGSIAEALCVWETPNTEGVSLGEKSQVTQLVKSICTWGFPELCDLKIT